MEFWLTIFFLSFIILIIWLHPSVLCVFPWSVKSSPIFVIRCFSLAAFMTCSSAWLQHPLSHLYSSCCSLSILNGWVYVSSSLWRFQHCMLSHSVVSDCLWPQGLQPPRLLCPWGFSRHGYWSGLPCPPPGDLPNPGIKPRSLTLQADFLLSEPPVKPIFSIISIFFLISFLFFSPFLCLFYSISFKAGSESPAGWEVGKACTKCRLLVHTPGLLNQSLRLRPREIRINAPGDFIYAQSLRMAA